MYHLYKSTCITSMFSLYYKFQQLIILNADIIVLQLLEEKTNASGQYLIRIFYFYFFLSTPPIAQQNNQIYQSLTEIENGHSSERSPAAKGISTTKGNNKNKLR